MHQHKGLVWLASYPKSGNTWFRVLLARLLNSSTNLNYINDLDNILGSMMVANRKWMDKTLGFDSLLLTHEEVEQMRPHAYQWFAQQVQQPTYIKTHDAYIYLNEENPLFPAAGCLGAIYFMRNPLDVAISLAHHANCPLDWSIEMMGNEQFFIPFKINQDKQIRQKLLSWSLHVKSWVSVSAFKVLILRYEDMFFKPFETFSKAITFLNLDVSAVALQQAIADAAFEKLQQYEKRFGFKEKLATEDRFFRKGIVDDWKTTLSQEQVEKIILAHGEVMQTYGYLDEKKQPVQWYLTDNTA